MAPFFRFRALPTLRLVPHSLRGVFVVVTSVFLFGCCAFPISPYRCRPSCCSSVFVNLQVTPFLAPGFLRRYRGALTTTAVVHGISIDQRLRRKIRYGLLSLQKDSQRRYLSKTAGRIAMRIWRLVEIDKRQRLPQRCFRQSHTASTKS